MLVFALCLLMKILEVSTGSTAEVDAGDTGTGEGGGAPTKPASKGHHGKKQRRRSRTPPPPIMRLIPSVAQEGACNAQTVRQMPQGPPTAMTTEVMANRTESSECDWNRNVDPERLRRRGGGRIITELSNTMNKQDLITSHESVEGRWLTECGSCGIGTSCSCCRTTSRHQGMASTLSLGGPVPLPGCLSASPLLSYDDMARHLDANLAQIDMEDFRTEDIHSLLALPTMCCADVQQTNRQGEMFASVSGSLMAKFDLESSISPRSSSQGEESGSTDMSICKSEPLFSPVKESPLPAAAANFSVDSLDCDLLAEQDIMLTCNKNNYTIAFEGSVTLCSEDSDYRETGDSESTSDNCSARLSALEDSCLVHSDSVYTTWSKLRRCSPRPPRCRCLLQRATRRPASTAASLLDNNNGDNSCTSSSNQSSSHNGNGNATSSASSASSYSRSTSAATAPSLAPATKSRSLPDLLPPPLAARAAAAAAPGAMTASALPGRCVRLYDVGVGDRLGGLVGLFVRGKGGSRIWDSAHFEDSLVVRGQQIPEEPAAPTESPPPDVVVSGSSGGGGDASSFSKLGVHSRGDDGKCRGTQTKTTADGELVTTSSSSTSTAASTPGDQQKQASRPPRSRSSVSIVTTRSASTQMPVYVADVGLQTSGRSDSVPCAFHARLDRGASADDGSPTVRVCYPNYSLPDLSFLEERRQKGIDLNVVLAPQKFRTVQSTASAAATGGAAGDVNRRNRARPLSCNDAEALRNRSFRHIKDWESLAVLLPTEYRRVLSEGMPAEGERSRGRTRNSECCDCSATSATGTTLQQHQSASPSSSSGFRGSSTLLSESPRTQSAANPCLAAMVAPAPPRRSISLPAAEDGGVVGGVEAPPRPPLPRGILRRGQGGSLGELRAGGGVEDWLSAEKRRQWGDEDEEDEEVEDEGVDTGMESSGERATEMRPPTPPVPRGGGTEGVRRSRPWSLPPSGVGSRQWCDEGRGKRKSVSFAEDVWVQKGSSEEGRAHQRSLLVDLSGKRALAQAVVGAVEQLCRSVGTGSRAAAAMAELATKTLCPALHDLLADGLKGTIDTVFGPVNNSPWRIAEASGGSQHKDYVDLVMRLNSEEKLKDGKMKFNAFIIGLLNTHALESWFLQLCKQDEVISKHYCPDGFMALAATATRGLTGHIGVALGSLSSLNLRLPLLYECGKQRRNDSDSQPLVPHPSPQQRPPVISGWAAPSLSQQGLGGYAQLGGGDSQGDHDDEDQAEEDRDEEDEEEDEGPLRLGRGLPYRSSAPASHSRPLPRPHAPPRPPPRPAEHSPRGGMASGMKAPRGNSRSAENINGNANQASPRADGAKFRRLQMQWEMLAGREEGEEESGGAGGGVKSRIPRPVTSPVRPNPPSLIPTGQPSVLKYRQRSKTAPQSSMHSKGVGGQDINGSGVDNGGGRTPVSTTSKNTGVVKRVPQRPGTRVPRPASVSSGYGLQRTKKEGQQEGERRIVRALCSRDASAGGHLAFLEGDELSVALDVDSRWLLCTRGDRRGLVPKAAVTPAATARVA
ncbi:mucin-19 isoform X2 [Ischnura elegans]|uniref:mucin-19 isoform X2 n=1 Tax=Ischnura elegans TaxID=197161 RepID=UPI001ED87187|nr:mucin-19 isoform X2 [Ischnura elegans]